MFHVEHRVEMRLLVCFLIIISAIGCNKPNPTPELADEIYKDLLAQAGASQKELEAEKKKFEGFKKELAEVIPQTGAIKYAQKRYFESEQRVQKLEQEKKFYELKAESRKIYTRQEYLKAFKAGKPWPSPEEVASYKTYKEVSAAPGGWNTKERVEFYEKTLGGRVPASKTEENPK